MTAAISNSLQKARSIVFFMEVCELFGRFGLNVLMVLYFKQAFAFTDEKAFTLFAGFSTSLFLTPIVCSFIVDKYISPRTSIIAGSLLNIVGSFLLSIPTLQVVYLGLVLIALGNGLFLPAMLQTVSRLFTQTKSKDTGFTIYWVVKNIGAILAAFMLGDLAQAYGFKIAFILNASVMIVGILLFMISRSVRIHSTKEDFKHQTQTLTQTNMFNIAFAFFLLVVFNACLNQGGMTLTLFIDRMVDRNILGHTFSPGFFYGLEPTFMIVAGCFLAPLYKYLYQKNKEPPLSVKAALGFSILGLGFLVFLLGSIRAGHTANMVSPLYIVGAYAIFPIAELMVNPICISIFDKNSPQKTKGFIFSLFALSQALASYLSGPLSNVGKIDFDVLTPSDFTKAAHIYSSLFSTTIGILLAVSLISIFVRLILKR